MINPKTTQVALVQSETVTATGTASSIFPHVSFPKKMTEERAANDHKLYRISHLNALDGQTSESVDPYFDNGSVYSNVVRDMTLDERKTALRTTLQQKFVSARDAGIIVAGTLIQTNRDAQQELEALVGNLTRNGGVQKVRTRSGVVIDADLAIATVLRDAVAAYVSAVWERDAVLGAAINDASSLEDLNGLDLDSGWPGGQAE